MGYSNSVDRDKRHNKTLICKGVIKIKYKIKPCPHCGGKPIISLLKVSQMITDKKTRFIDYDAVTCKACGSMSIGNTVEETIEAWNRRDTPAEEIREKLKEIVNSDNVDTLVEVMRILEGWNDGRTANDI